MFGPFSRPFALGMWGSEEGSVGAAASVKDHTSVTLAAGRDPGRYLGGPPPILRTTLEGGLPGALLSPTPFGEE